MNGNAKKNYQVLRPFLSIFLFKYLTGNSLVFNKKSSPLSSFKCKHGYNSLAGGAIERPNIQISSRLGETKDLSWA